MPHYRIYEYADSADNRYYRVAQSAFFGLYWFIIKEQSGEGEDCTWYPVEFKTREQAEQYIDNVTMAAAIKDRKIISGSDYVPKWKRDQSGT